MTFNIKQYLSTILLVSITFCAFSQQTIPVDPFSKIIISPHIEVNFVQGDKESVRIENISVSKEKLTVEVSGKTLQIYLEGAKTYTKSKKNEYNYNKKESIYKGTVVTATVTYKSIDELSLRGEQTFNCENLQNQGDFKLTLYGESQVYFNNVKLNTIHTSIYGESFLEFKAGSINRHKITSYGDSEINTLNVSTKSAKITAYGESEVNINVLDDLKITSYGESKINYSGNATVSKGIVIGETKIRKITP